MGLYLVVQACPDVCASRPIPVRHPLLLWWPALAGWLPSGVPSPVTVTCIWQIIGRNNIKFDEWMKLDIMFIENKKWLRASKYF